jgi:phosphatidylinositol dimannoside acyltransferase
MTHQYRGSGLPGAPVDRNPGAADRIPPDTRPEGWRLKVTAILWVTMWELGRRLPERLVHAVADVVARVLHRVAGGARARVTRNFARVVAPADLERTVREAYRSYARYWVEAFRAADISPADIDRRTTSEGFEHLDAALEEGQGVVVLLAHHGSWDTAARWAETRGYHLAVVAEVVRPRALFRKFVKLREDIGLEVVPLQRGATMVGRLAEVAKANHLVGLLTDRDLTGKAPVVEFFGEPARIPLGPVIVSQRTGAAIIPITMIQRPGGRWLVKALPKVEVADLPLPQASQRVAEALEALIRTAPEQWHAFQPVWLADLPPSRRGDWQPDAPAPGGAGAGEAPAP